MRARPPAQPNASLISGLECLREITASGTPVGVRDMARRLDMEPTRAHRLMKTLASEGYLNQNDSGKYGAGPAMHLLSARSLHGSGLMARAVPALNELRSFESVIALGLLWRDEVVYLFHTRPGESVMEGLAREPVFPASRSSIGQAVMALWPEDDVRDLYRNRPVPGFPDHESLRTALAGVRRDGYACVEYSAGVHSVGIALDRHSGIALGSLDDRNKIPGAVAALRLARERIVGVA